MQKNQLLPILSQVGVIAMANYMAAETSLPWICLVGLAIFSVTAIAAQLAMAKSAVFDRIAFA